MYPSRSQPQVAVGSSAAVGTVAPVHEPEEPDHHHHGHEHHHHEHHEDHPDHHHHHHHHGPLPTDLPKPQGIWRLLDWLEEGTVPTVGKIVLLAASALAPAAYAPALLAGTYTLAGPPAIADLCRNLAARAIDTHVLMALAALGTVLCGHPTEVNIIIGFKGRGKLGVLVSV